MFGGTASAGTAAGAGTIVRSTGGLLAEGLNFKSDAVVFAKRSAAGLAVEALGTVTDPAGERFYFLSRWNSGDIDAREGRGRQEITGGTGRFAGIRGECDFRIDYLSPTLAVIHQSCRWEQP